MLKRTDTSAANKSHLNEAGKQKPSSAWFDNLKLCCIAEIPKTVLAKLHKAEDPTTRNKKSTKAAGLAGVAAAAFAASHIPCIVVGAASLLGLGGYVYSCHEGQDLESLQQYEEELGLQRLHAVPDSFTDIPNDQERLAILMRTNPDFQRIIDWKQKNEPESEIEVDFIMDSEGNELGVVCKDGKLCPCSDPLVYKTGS